MLSYYSVDKNFKEIKEIIDKLAAAYPNARCELNYGSLFELLVAVILSAQCTDKRVNQVTEILFKIANTPDGFAQLPQEELEKLIYSCGFYRNKARSIIEASQDILERFGGEVPDSFDGLISLRGVGRKTANVILSVAFNKDAIAVDTHVFRVAGRLGLSGGNTPLKVEEDLNKLFLSRSSNNNMGGENQDKGGKSTNEENHGINNGQQTAANIHHLLIFHGRYCCRSRRPDCGKCPVREHCTEYALSIKNKKSN